MRKYALVVSLTVAACGGQPAEPVEPTPRQVPEQEPIDTSDEPAPEPKPALDAEGKRITHAETEEECRACNGSWGPRGIIGALGCVCPTIDGGKPCRSPSDCEHRCELDWEQAVAAGQLTCKPDGTCAGGKQLPQGHCSYDFDIFGCRAWFVETETDDGPVITVRHVCVD